MNLTELQMELRNIQSQISTLEDAIERMKHINDQEKESIYQKITALALCYPINNDKLMKCTDAEKLAYIKAIAYVAVQEENNLIERLLYLTRIAVAMDSNKYNAQYIYKLGNSFDKSDVSNMAMDLENVREDFMLDLLLIVNISNMASKEMLMMVVEFATILNVKKNDLEMISLVAKAILTEDYSLLDILPANAEAKWNNKFQYYLGKQMESKRDFCGQYICEKSEEEIYYKKTFCLLSGSSYEPCEVLRKTEEGSLVRKGDELLIYKQGKDDKKNKKSIKALKDGIVYYIKDKIKNEEYDIEEEYEKVYVVSVFDTRDNFVKWYKGEK